MSLSWKASLFVFVEFDLPFWRVGGRGEGLCFSRKDVSLLKSFALKKEKETPTLC